MKASRLFFLLTLLATSAVHSRLAAGSIVRLSVKFILDEDGDRPTGHYEDLTDVRDAVREANTGLRTSGICWRFQLVDLLDVTGASEFFVVSSADEMWSLEAEAMLDPAKFKWNPNAINIYVVEDLHGDLEGRGGVCSYPVNVQTFQAREIVLINSNDGTNNDGLGWLHEIGHYLSLTHTFDCQYLGCGEDEDVCRGMGAYYFDGAHRWAECSDVCPDTFNIMSYHEFDTDEGVFSPCQIQHMNFHLFDDQGLRSHVVDHQPVLVPLHYPTVAQGIDAACPGEVVLIQNGIYPEATLRIEKHVVLKANGGGARVTE